MKLLDYSTKDFIIMILLLYFFYEVGKSLHNYGLLLGLGGPNLELYNNLGWMHNLSPNSTSLGWVTRTFFAVDLPPLLLIVTLLSVCFSTKISSRLPKLTNFLSFWRVATSIIVVFSGFLIVSIIKCGVRGTCDFFGYRFSSIIALFYCGLTLYLIYYSKNEGASKAILFTVLGVLTVSNLWELPLALYNHSKVWHPFFVVLGIFRTNIPVFLWFYICRNVYRYFIRECIGITVSLVSLIIPLTICLLTKEIVGTYWFELGLGLRILYGLLLVFLPFHFYTMKQK